MEDVDVGDVARDEAARLEHRRGARSRRRRACRGTPRRPSRSGAPRRPSPRRSRVPAPSRSRGRSGSSRPPCRARRRAPSSPRRARSSSMCSSRRRPSVGLTPASGSSRRTRRGASISARASSSSLRWPPESVPAYAPACGASSNVSSSSSARVRASRSRRRAAHGRTNQRAQPLAGMVRRGEQHVVEHAHHVQRLRHLERPHEPAARDRVRGQPVDRAAVEPDRAAVGALEARDDVEERRLARAVRADQRRDRAALDDEARAVDRAHAAVALLDAFDLEDRRHSPSSISCFLPRIPCGRNAISRMSTSPTMMKRIAATLSAESGSST